ncbi:MAG TPA: flagellar FlbD family protein [Ilumatobacteraceae bacterium]|nr:flagellar FlbD family protein [Ilumatobacteraceae bacterium]
MIRLTRLRQTDPFFVNPDHIERIEHHHDVLVHLFNGTEFVVNETPEEIIASVREHRALILVAARLMSDESVDTAADLSAILAAERG